MAPSSRFSLCQAVAMLAWHPSGTHGVARRLRWLAGAGTFLGVGSKVMLSTGTTRLALRGAEQVA